jgi:hypothetical protein
MRTTALKVGAFQRSVPYAPLLTDHVGRSSRGSLELPNDLPRHPQPTKGLKQVGQALAHLLVGIQTPGAIWLPHIADGEGEVQEPFAGFVPAPLIEARAQGKEFCFREGALHTKQKAIIGIAGIVDGALIGQ